MSLPLHERFRAALTSRTGELYAGGASMTWTLLDDYMQPHASQTQLAREMHTVRTDDGMFLYAAPRNVIAEEDLNVCNVIVGVNFYWRSAMVNPAQAFQPPSEEYAVLESQTLLSNVFQNGTETQLEGHTFTRSEFPLHFSDVNPVLLRCHTTVEVLTQNRNRRTLQSMVVFIPNNDLVQLQENYKSLRSVEKRGGLLATLSPTERMAQPAGSNDVPEPAAYDVQKINLVVAGVYAEQPTDGKSKRSRNADA